MFSASESFANPVHVRENILIRRHTFKLNIKL